jgi:RNA polymerase sigma-70 factor (ECF subfamily)
MQVNYYKPGTLITFGSPSTDTDFLTMLQVFIEREAERRQRIVSDWLAIRIDGLHQRVIDSESWCRLEFEGGTSKVEIVGRDGEGEVVIATYLPTYDGPKKEAWKVSLPWGDEVSCTFEYDDEECVRVEAKRIVRPKLSEMQAQPTRTAPQKFVGFDRAYVERLRNGDPATEHHFFVYFEKFLNLKLRARAVPSARMEDLRQEMLIRVITALRRGAEGREPERFGAFVDSVCNQVLLERNRAVAKSHTLEEALVEISDRVLDLEAARLGKQSAKHVPQILNAMPPGDRGLLRAASLEGRDKGSVCREFGADRAYLRVLLDRAKDKFRSLYGSLTSRSGPLTLFDPSPGRCEPDLRLTRAHETPLAIDPLRVFLVAESAPLRESLSCVFRNAGISVVGQSGDCDLTAKEIVATQCDVLLVNPGRAVNNKAKTMELLREILVFTPRMRVIVLGMIEDPGCFLEAVRSGVLGYLLKDASATEIISAVRSIKRGEIVCPPRLLLTLLQHFSQGRFQTSHVSHHEANSRGLTDRQRELFGSCRPRVDK